ELLAHDHVRVGATRVGGEEHQGVLALLGDLQWMIRVAEREHRLPRRERLRDLGAPAGDDEGWRRDALVLEELLLLGDEVLAVDERRDAVRDRDRLRALRPRRRSPG